MTSINHHRLSTSLTLSEDPAYALHLLEEAVDAVSDMTIGRVLPNDEWVRLEQLTTRLVNLVRNAEVEVEAA